LPVPTCAYRRTPPASRRTTSEIFACVFSPTTPWTTWHAGLLELARVGDVRLLVEPGLELDQRHDLLAELRGADQRADDRALLRRGAVHRLLDREDGRIVGGLLDEGLHEEEKESYG
jgi:hypothetical protein